SRAAYDHKPDRWTNHLPGAFGSRRHASSRYRHCGHLSAQTSVKKRRALESLASSALVEFGKSGDYGLLGDARSKAPMRLLRSSISLPLFIAVTIPQIATPPSASTPMTANQPPVSISIPPAVLPAGGGPCGSGAGIGAGDGKGDGPGSGMGAL